MNKKVLVAMSGGVDSSVAAFLLKEKGYETAGLTMCLGSREGDNEKPRCCSPGDIEDARRVCDQLKIPHYVLDFSWELEEEVINKFIAEYIKGRTPNPCIDCNRTIKFGALLKEAISSGFEFLATGHYARIEKDGQGYFLKKPKDQKKDQTYFLYPIVYDTLKYLLFPLSPFTKEEVRALARKANLPVAEKSESQDLCFVNQKNYQAFVLEKHPEMRSGPIIDIKGNILGEHKGIVFYTIGQRSGLGISHPTPLYVVSKDMERNLIIVGEKKALMAKGLIAGELNVLVSPWPSTVYAKIRYRKREVKCVTFPEDDRLRVIFDQEQEAVTPGQAVVFYDQDLVLGGGVIEGVLLEEEHGRPGTVLRKG